MQRGNFNVLFEIISKDKVNYMNVQTKKSSLKKLQISPDLAVPLFHLFTMWITQYISDKKCFCDVQDFQFYYLYEQVSVSSGTGRTGCWHEYKSLRKRGINFISKPIDILDYSCAGKMFNFNFVCIAVVQNS